MKSKLTGKARAGKITEDKSGKPPGKSVIPKVSKTHKPAELELEEWQRLLRRQFGQQQNFLLKNTGGHPTFSEFSLINSQTGKTYRIAIRGVAAGHNYCSCPDYAINNLGTCKHIEFTLAQLMKKRSAQKAFSSAYLPPIPRCT